MASIPSSAFTEGAFNRSEQCAVRARSAASLTARRTPPTRPGRVLATLIRVPGDFDLAEEALQRTFGLWWSSPEAARWSSGRVSRRFGL
jgi:hypothetical protein